MNYEVWTKIKPKSTQNKSTREGGGSKPMIFSCVLDSRLIPCWLGASKRWKICPLSILKSITIDSKKKNYWLKYKLHSLSLIEIVRSFLIYTTVSFFKKLYPLCVLKILRARLVHCNNYYMETKIKYYKEYIKLECNKYYYSLVCWNWKLKTKIL